MAAIVALPERRTAPAPGDLLLTTRLLPPPLRDSLVTRPRLIRALEQAAAGTLTLLVAPAGYGKTTLLSTWVASLSPEFSRTEQTQNSQLNTQHSSVAWLTLDTDANDPARFWAALLAALRLAHPALHLSLEPSPAALVALLNRLAAHPGQLALVLDNYQTIHDPRIQRALCYHGSQRCSVRRCAMCLKPQPPRPIPEATAALVRDLFEEERQTLAVVVGDDGVLLLDRLMQEDAAHLTQLRAVETLRDVWAVHYQRGDDNHMHWTTDGERGGAHAIETPYDDEARWSEKRGNGWVGYKLQATETDDADQPHLITDIAVTPATQYDSTALPDIRARQQAHGVLPRERYGDSSYLSGTMIARGRLCLQPSAAHQ